MRQDARRIGRWVGLSLALTAVLSPIMLSAAATTPPPATQGSSAAPVLGRERAESGRRLVRELPGLRTRTSRTYVDESGARVARVFPGSVNYRAADGSWRPVDTDLVRVGGHLENRAGAYSVELPARLGTSPLKVKRGDDWVAFALRGATAAGEASGSSVRYADVRPGVDAVYTVQADALKEEIVLRRPGTAPRLSFELDASDGLTIERTPAGALEVLGADGKRRFSLERPFMVDAAGAVSYDVAATLERDASGWRLELVPDRQWLSHPKRELPVTIDPPVAPTPTRDCTISVATDGRGGGEESRAAQRTTAARVSSDGACSSPSLTTGGLYRPYIDWDQTGYYADHRPLLHFDVAGAMPPDSEVVSASLDLYLRSSTYSGNQVGAYAVTKAWTTAVTWTQSDTGRAWTRPGGDFDSPTGAPQVGGASGVNRWYRWDVSAIARAWVSGARANHGLLLRRTCCNANASTQQFDAMEAGAGTRPYLEVVYRLIDRTAPSLTVSGALKQAAGGVLTPGSYDLRADATDPAPSGGSSGVKSIEIKVDGERADHAEQPCDAGGCAMSRTWALSTDAYSPGPHTVQVIARDHAGLSSNETFVVTVADAGSALAAGVGFEEYFEYRSLDTGAGSQALVNVGNGNLLWHHRPVSNLGRGLSTNVDITYNSMSGGLDLGHGYAELGDGFSLAISSLTRVNEALDVRAAAAGLIVLTDADGTMHRFRKNPGGAWFDPPPGVNLRLRRFYDSPSTDEQKAKVWAATRADGVTYFFDACGYQRSVEDRNGNVLRFEYEAPLPIGPACLSKFQTLRPKLRRVVDAAGVDDPALAAQRSLTIDYEPAPLVLSGQRIARITDHAGRKTEFAYVAGDTKLASITEAAGTAVQRTFRFEYETTGLDRDLTAITDPRNARTRVSYKPDDSLGGAPLFGRGERAETLTDRRDHVLRFAYRAAAPDLETDVTDRRGKVWTYRTDGQRRLVKLTDPRGTVVVQSWDTDNNLAQVKVAAGTPDEAVTTTTWNGNGRPLRMTDPNQHVTELTYRDGPGRHLAQSGVDAGKGFVSDLTKVTPPRGTETAVADDFATRFDVDANGNVTSRRDGENYLTEWTYTTRGLLERERRETDRGRFSVTTFSDFDPNGLPRLSVDARGNDTAAGGDGHWRARYDAVANLTDLTDPRGSGPPTAAIREAYTTEYDYDALDRPTLERVPKLSTAGTFIERRTEYDANGNVKATVDGNGKRSTRDYTPMDDVEVSRTPPVPHEGEAGDAAEETRYAYDEEQNLALRTDPLGTAPSRPAVDAYTTAYTYDAVGDRVVERRRSRTASESKDLVTSWAYDRRGNVVGVADPKRNATGDPVANAATQAKQRWTFQHDRADNRAKAVEDPGGKCLTTLFGYDANDNQISITDARGGGSSDPAVRAKHTTKYGYDGRDALVDVTDPKNRRTHYDVRGDGLLSALTTPRGTASAMVGDFQTSLAYDPMGDPTSRTIPWAPGQYGPRNWRVLYERDAVGNPRTITDARGNAFVNEFLDTGELRKTGRPGFWVYDESAGGLRERTPDDPPAGQQGDPEVAGDARGDFGAVDPEPLPDVLPKAGSTDINYDGELRVVSVLDAAGNATRLDRDALGRILAHDVPFSGNRRTRLAFAYDRNGNTRRSTDGEQATTRDLDQFDRLIAEHAPGSATQRETTGYAYDDNDNLARVATPRGPAWTYGYDAVDRRETQTDPFGKVTSSSYDAVGNMTSLLPPRGQGRADRDRYATFWDYNEADELVKQAAGRGHADGISRETTFEYDLDGNQSKRTEPGSASAPGGALAARVTRSTYDGRDLLWAETTGSGSFERTTVTEFDANGNLRRRVGPAGVKRDTELPRVDDPGGAPTASSTWTEHATVFAYDSDDLLTKTYLPWGRKDAKDAERYVMDVERDARGRILNVYSPFLLGAPRGRASTYTHFENGWISTGTDNGINPHTLRYDYDLRGNQTLWQSQGKQREVRRTFHPNGRLATRVAESTVDGVLRRRSYRYGYNPNRSLSQLVDEDKNRTTNLSYDNLERQTVVNETWSNAKDTRSTYDDDGNVLTRQTDGRWDAASSTYVGGKTTTFTYDEQSREMRMVAQQAGETATRTTEAKYYPSDEISQRERTRSGTTARILDRRFFADDGRLVRLRRERVGTATPLKDEPYGYDDANNASTDPAVWGNGNRSSDERGTHVFNARGQLRRWTRKGAGATSVLYDLDGEGQITRKLDANVETTYTYAGGRLENSARKDPVTGAIRRTDYRYNIFNNLREIDPSPGAVGDDELFYDWDEFERLTGARGAGVPATGPTYAYDALDRRDSRREDGKAYDYSYVGATEQLSREDVPGATEGRYYDYDSGLERIGQATKAGSGAVTYRSYASDGNGSVEGLEDGQGAVAADAAYAYDPYGELLSSAAAGSPAAGNPFRFQGHYYDQAVKTYDMQARHYRPDLQRFLSEDRFQSAGQDLSLQLDPLTHNRYVFLGGNPVDQAEFDGHEPRSSFRDRRRRNTPYCCRQKPPRRPSRRRFATPDAADRNTRPVWQQRIDRSFEDANITRARRAVAERDRPGFLERTYRNAYKLSPEVRRGTGFAKEVGETADALAHPGRTGGQLYDLADAFRRDPGGTAKAVAEATGRHYTQDGPDEGAGRLLAGAAGGKGFGAAVSAARTAARAGRAGKEAARIRARAAELHGALDPRAQHSRTSAVLSTRQGRDVLAGGVRDLDPSQRALAGENDLLGRLPGAHAEKTALQAAARARLTPSAIETTTNICPACRALLEGSGATITGPRSARWPR